MRSRAAAAGMDRISNKVLTADEVGKFFGVVQVDKVVKYISF